MACTSTARMIAGPDTSAALGRVRWAPAKSLWTGGMMLAAMVLGPLFVTPGAVLLFVATALATLCAGHSVGMHRLLVHRSFQARPWVERLLVYLGTLSGWPGRWGWSCCTTCGTGRSARRPATTCTPTGCRCCATP